MLWWQVILASRDIHLNYVWVVLWPVFHAWVNTIAKPSYQRHTHLLWSSTCYSVNNFIIIIWRNFVSITIYETDLDNEDYKLKYTHPIVWSIGHPTSVKWCNGGLRGGLRRLQPLTLWSKNFTWKRFLGANFRLQSPFPDRTEDKSSHEKLLWDCIRIFHTGAGVFPK